MNNEEKEKAMLADDLTVYIKDKHTSDEVVGFIEGYKAALNKFKELGLGYVSGSTLTAKDATLEILEWIKSDDCWITDKDGNRLPDAIIDGIDLNKRLEKYYR